MGIDARMFSRYRGEKPTPDQLKLWSWDLCRAIGAKHFFIDPKTGRAALFLSDHYEGDEKVSDGRIYSQDGEDVIADSGEWLVEANWQTIVHSAEWMERFIGPVWYGGDSSGVCAQPFGREVRDKLVAHALSLNGRDYFNAFERDPFKTPPPCSLCVKERGHTRHGWGANFIKTACGGCGCSFETRDNGKTWTEVKEPS